MYNLVVKLNVKGQTYTVIERELDSDHGQCLVEDNVIYIDSSEKTKGKLRRITLAHELFHAYLDEMYIADIISDDLEEILCELVAHFVDRHGRMILDFE